MLSALLVLPIPVQSVSAIRNTPTMPVLDRHRIRTNMRLERGNTDGGRPEALTPVWRLTALEQTWPPDWYGSGVASSRSAIWCGAGEHCRPRARA